MSNKSKNFFYITVIILEAAGGIIFNYAPVVGGILIVFGALAGILFYLSSSSKSKQGEYLFDAQVMLLAKQGVGNVYAEAVKLELKKTGLTKNSMQLLVKALEIEPNNLDALEMICVTLALDLSLMKWARIPSTNDDVHKTLELAKMFTKKGLALAPNLHVFHDTKGIIYDCEGKHNKARKEFSISGTLRTDPYWHLLLSTSFQMSNQHGEALLEMEKARGKGAIGWLFEFYYGRALQAVGNYEKALEHLENAIKQVGWKAEPLQFLSGTHYSLGNYFKSAKYKGMTGIAVITISFNSGFKYLLESFLHLFLCLICKFSKIIWRLTKYIPVLRTIQLKTIPPFEPEFNIGYSLVNKQHYKAAEKLFSRACSIVPKYDLIHANLARCLAMQGNKNEAIESIDRAIELNPKNESFAWYREQLLNGSTLNNKKV